MNPLITQYKKVILSLVAVVAMGSSAALLAECKPCALAAAIKQSIKDAHAAAIAAGKPSKPSKPKHSREARLDQLAAEDVRIVQACCEYCAKYGINCCGINNARCATCESGLIKVSLAQAAAAALEAATVIAHEAELDAIEEEDTSRAAREEQQDSCLSNDDLDSKLCALLKCCVDTNQQVRCQSRHSEKCCNQLRHRIHTVKELIEEQIEDSEECCTLLENLIISQIDSSAECCTLLENLIISQIDSSADCCTLLENLIISQIDQNADCCSVIEIVLGDPTVTITSFQDCGIDILGFVNSNNDDVLTWLKRLYVLMYQVFSCTCCD